MALQSSNEPHQGGSRPLELPSSEWLLIASLLLLMASLWFVAKVNGAKSASLIESAVWDSQEIAITVEGAVEKPGTYRIEAGTALSEILRKARPLPSADIKNLPLDRRLEAPEKIHVEPLTEIRVKVCGAVDAPVELVLPVNSRISDLKSKVQFTNEADKRFFRRKKMLRDGDVIEVPKKTVEVKSGT